MPKKKQVANVAEDKQKWVPGQRPPGFKSGYMVEYHEGFLNAQRRMIQLIGEAKLGRPPIGAEELLDEYEPCDDFESLALDTMKCSTWEQVMGKLVCRIKRRPRLFS